VERVSRRRPPPWIRLLPILVALAAFVPFLPALSAEFVTWDDNRNFLDNPHYRGLGWDQVRWMWATFHMGHYVPLSWMTLGLDYELWGMNAAGYHLQNVLLHAANAVLVYVIARRLLTIGASSALPERDLAVPSLMAALVFAIHPLRVESVAWVTERRDMLSLLFALASVLAYLRYHTGGESSRRTWYVTAVALFVCGLLSKATVMTLPAVLLLLSVYPLRSLGGAAGWWSASARRTYLDIGLFAALAVAVSMISLVALDPPRQLGLVDKLAVSAYSLAFYVWKTIVPASLAPLYEMPAEIDPLAPRYVVSYVLVIALSGAAIAARRRWPGVAAAWAAFVLITLPMLGIVQNGPQIAADRYTYHAAPVVGVLAGGVVARWQGRRRRGALLATGTVLCLLAVLTWRQTTVWLDSDRLWSRVLSVDSTSSIAQIAMGDLRIEQGRFDEAAYHYARGVALDADYAEGHNNLGVALSRIGRDAEAVEHFRMAVTLDSAYADAHANWGVALGRLGDEQGAVEHFRRAIALDGGHADARVNYGNTLTRLGQAEAAIAEYEAADRVRPRHAVTHLNWGAALAQLRRYGEAADHFQTALSIDPTSPEARRYLDAATALAERERAGEGRPRP